MEKLITQIINGRILTPAGWIQGGSVVVEGNKISEIQKSASLIDGAQVVDAKEGNIVPGGIDLHIHGGGGRDYMEGTEDAFLEAIHAHMLHGTTSIYPTLSSSSPEMIERAIRTTEKLMEDPDSPVLGLHLEGPYFNPEMAGGQLPEYITPPIKADYERIILSTNVIKRWDEAPELPGTEEFGRFCTQHGVMPAIAHTKAEYNDVKKAWDSGFRHATHFYNAMTGFHKVREYKHEGTVESVYAIPEMTVEMITDGIHVPPTILRMIYLVKGVERTALITDALGVSASNSNKAFDPRVIIEDGVCKLADHSALAGSIATMDRLVKTAVMKVGIPLEDAIRMTSETPAHIMKEDGHIGTIRKGYDASIVVYDNDIALKFVMQMGKIVRNDL
ncbi:MAG TPA: N-acetylglucosamine-6-phosphate deacetylase [Prevotellaceae bacterium]|nr:N-acetylglucosamine-6-phosphate deacetylase [Prevotellaceae bacterium]